MELWTAFLLGLVGSLHCAGMCGPLALALPGGTSPAAFWLGRLAYNFGRLLTYGLLGALLGIIGHSLALAGIQRWVSLSAGLALLTTLAVSSRFSLSARVARPVGWLKTGLSALLRRPHWTATLLLGILNGLLPCGLVYAAAAAAIASGGFFSALKYMLCFGLGTIPMMLAIGGLGKKFQFTLRFKLSPLIPVCWFLLGALLIVRGLALGIPYLSPDVAQPCCHQ